MTAIKRAYAAKLKAIDPDREVEAFLELRAAFDLARQQSDGDSAPRPARMPVVEAAGPEPAATPAAVVVDRPKSAPPQPVPAPERDPRSELAELFRRRAKRDAGAAERAARALFDHAAMDNVGFASEVELWLARLIVETAPRADAILALAAERFGWRRFDGMMRVDPAIAGALQRLNDLEASERLRAPAHRWNALYKMLEQPAPVAIARGDLLLYGPFMGDMLDSLRFHNPGILRSLDRAHVRLWEEAVVRQRSNPAAPRADGVSWFGWFILAAVVANIAALASRWL
ncbi:MAG: hypothetical protein JNL35_19195 [Sphingopyxis sp.]|nr:hypothetical protein [Sphingopyxis sp.]